MSNTTIVIGLLSLLLGIGYLNVTLPASAAPPKPERPRCENCGMYTDVSSTRVTAQVVLDGKLGDHGFVCVDCILEKLEKWGDEHAVLKGFKILDYSTFGSKSEKMIDGKTAFFLYGTSELPGSMEPYIAAFASKSAAQAAQKKLGGTLIEGSAKVLAKIEAESKEADSDSTSKVAGKEDQAPAETYVCPCSGGCCDDISSDKPGECPKCGMQLVPKSEKDQG